ncbi:DUF3558 family protein [Nocardia asteroides]|uniref:DUF3558 family protein n=1 Tax=Nocardia asteroides TaxID=1824 RepID=UPI0037CC6241
MTTTRSTHQMVPPKFTALVFATSLTLLLAGCNTNSDSAGEAPIWDPCDAFPASAMKELGFDYKSSVQSPGLECGWLNTATGYGPDIRYLSKGAVDEGWRSKAASLIEITIGQYSGYQYRTEGIDPNFVCSIRLQTENSSVEFSVVNQNYGAEDPCPIVLRVATDLADYLPPPAR